MKFGELLDKLEAAGRSEEAHKHELAINAKFMGLKSPEEIRDMDIDLMSEFFQLVDFYKQNDKLLGSETPFAQYVDGLRARGYSVRVSSEYQQYL